MRALAPLFLVLLDRESRYQRRCREKPRLLQSTGNPQMSATSGSEAR